MKRKLSAFAFAACVLLAGCQNKAGVDTTVSDTVKSDDNGEVPQGASNSKEDIVITLGLMIEPEQESLVSAIEEFNNADNGCRIETKIFASRNDSDGFPHAFTEDELASIDFETVQQIMNKGGIDIVGDVTFGDDAKYWLLRQKGAFADLYDFMENDPEVNTSTLNSHILKLNEINGKLYNIPRTYEVNTMISKSEYGGTKQNWTIDEFIDRWNAMPEGSTIAGSINAEYIFYNILRENTPAFVDEENAKVTFDSPDFRKILEFCKQFPSINGEKGEYDHNAPSLASKYLITSANSAIISDMNYQTYERKQYRLRDGKYTLVGYPTSNREGAYLTSSLPGWSICSSSSAEKQEAAWKFIRQFYTEEFQTENAVQKYEIETPEGVRKTVDSLEGTGFCINNAARKKVAENIMNNVYDFEDISTAQGHEITVDNIQIDEKDIEFLENYTDSINRWDNRVDRNIFWIVNDEVMTYLGGGQDIDTTISMIQNRASLWVSETY